MGRDARAYLWDVRESADAIASFIGSTDREGYRNDAMLRSAVERQLEIIGEALNQLSQAAPEVAAVIPNAVTRSGCATS